MARDTEAQMGDVGAKNTSRPLKTRSTSRPPDLLFVRQDQIVAVDIRINLRNEHITFNYEPFQ